MCGCLTLTPLSSLPVLLVFLMFCKQVCVDRRAAGVPASPGEKCRLPEGCGCLLSVKAGLPCRKDVRESLWSVQIHAGSLLALTGTGRLGRDFSLRNGPFFIFPSLPFPFHGLVSRAESTSSLPTLLRSAVAHPRHAGHCTCGEGAELPLAWAGAPAPPGRRQPHLGKS